MPTEYISKIKPAGQGGDYTSVITWEAAVQMDLTASNVFVFTGALIGSIGAGNNVTLYSGGINQGLSGSAYVSTGQQILVNNISSGYIFSSGNEWRLSSSTGNYFVIYNSGDTPILVGEIDGNWSGLSPHAYTVIDGSTTNAINYIKLRAVGQATHNGYWDSNKFNFQNLWNNSYSCLEVDDHNTEISGLQFFGISVLFSAAGFLPGATGIIVKNCITRGVTYSTQYNYGFGPFYHGGTTSSYYYNCITYDNRGTSSCGFIAAGNGAGSSHTMVLYNPLAYNCTIGYKAGSYSSITAWNSVASLCSTDYSSVGGYGIGSSTPITWLTTGGPANGDFRISIYDTGLICRGTGLSTNYPDITGGIRGTGNQLYDMDFGPFHSPVIARTISPSGGHYTSLSGWEVGQRRNLIDANKIAYGVLSGSWSNVDSGLTIITGWTTGPSNYIQIFPFNSTVGHTGFYDNSKYKLSHINSYNVKIVTPYVKISGLQFELTGIPSSDNANISIENFTTDSGLVVVNNCLFKYHYTGGSINSSRGICNNNSNVNTFIYNCLGSGYSGSETSSSFTYANDISKNSGVNITTVNSVYGFGSGFTYKNCLAQYCTTGFQYADSNSSHNSSEDSNYKGEASKTGTAIFIDYLNGDYRLNFDDMAATYRGSGFSGLFTLDLAGSTRGISGAPWSIGAFESIFVSNSGRYVYPSSDIDSGTWTVSPLYSKISGFYPDGINYISSISNPTGDTCTIGIPTTTPTASTGHSVHYMYRKGENNSDVINLTVGIYQGDSLIKESIVNGISSDWTVDCFELSSEEAGLISDYSLLRLKFAANTG